MSSGSSALALALGAGGGLALWYLTRDTGESPADAPAPPAPAPPAPMQSLRQGVATTASPRGPCVLQLSGSGLTADGARVDVAAAVARCKGAGSADLHLSSDAPGMVYLDLAQALAKAGVTITSRRNGRTRGRPKSRRQAVHPVELGAFARTVLDLAAGIEEKPTADGHARGRFGRKVFIAAIRRALGGTEYARLTREQVDALLVHANRDGLLQLARADLVGAMDDAELRASELRSLGSTFHFVLAERTTRPSTQSTHERHTP